MQNIYRKTIKDNFSISGKGVHTDGHCTVTLSPAEFGRGIIFKRNDVSPRINNLIEAKFTSIQQDKLLRRTTLCNSTGISVSTVEHLMAALFALGITDVIVEIDNAEMPILDGSAKIWCEKLLTAGIVASDSFLLDSFSIKEPFVFEEDDSEYSYLPYDGFQITYIYRSKWKDHSILSYNFDFTQDAFINDIAPARTFCLFNDVKLAWEMGLALGGSLNNAVVIGRKSIINPDGLRFEDEPVRHKLLDFIGDLSLINRWCKGHFTIVNGSHNANALFVKRLNQEIIENGRI